MCLTSAESESQLSGVCNMQLLLIEGVPGSGKTTTAKETCRHLSSIGIRAKLVS